MMRNEKGIGFVDILIGSLILFIIIMAVIMLFFIGSKNIVSAGNATTAIKLCQEGLEIIKKMKTQSIPMGTFPPDNSLIFPQGTYGTVTVGKVNGVRTVAVRGIIDPQSTGTKTSYLEIMVSVAWDEAGKRRSRVVGTYKR